MTAARHNHPSNLSGLRGPCRGEHQDVQLIVEGGNGRVWSDGVEESEVACVWVVD